MTREEKMAVWEALDQIQHAQMLVGEAAQKLCPVEGFADEWTKICRLYDTIKAHWHDVNNLHAGMLQKMREEENR